MTSLSNDRGVEQLHQLIAALPCPCDRCQQQTTEEISTFFQLLLSHKSTIPSPLDRFAHMLSQLDAANLHPNSISTTTSPPNPPSPSPPPPHPGRDTMVQRFLAAAKGNLEKACHLLTSTLIWRHAYGKGMGSLALRQQRLHVVDHYYTLGLLNDGHLRDKEGRTVWVERVGRSDCQVVTTEGSVFHEETLEESFIRSHVTLYLHALSFHSQRILIMDMEQLTTSHVGSTVAMGVRRVPGLCCGLWGGCPEHNNRW